MEGDGIINPGRVPGFRALDASDQGYAASYAIAEDGATDVGFVRLGCIPPD